MRAVFCLFLISAVFLHDLAVAAEDESLLSREDRRARKPHRPVQQQTASKSSCPSKCELGRRIQNTTRRFSADLNRLNRRITAREDNQNLVSTQQLDNVRVNLNKKIEKAVDGLFSYVADKEALQEIKEKAKPCCAEESISDLQAQMASMEVDMDLLRVSQDNVTATVNELLDQNVLLRENAKALQEVARVVREQNEELTRQNQKLVADSARWDKKLTDLDERLTALEDFVANDNCTCDYVQVELLSAAMEPPLILGSQSITKMETNQRDTENKLQKIEDWVKASVKSVSWLPTLEPPVNPMLQGNIDQAPRDCFEIFHMGFRESGPYKIQPDNSPVPFEVFCEQRYNGGGWTVFQRRRDGSESFDRSYEEYAKGFGDVVGEFWLGNDKIHHITSQGPHVMHVALQDWDNKRAYAEYDDFFVDTPRNSYMLRFGMYRGTAGDAFRGRAVDGSKNILFAGFSAQDYDNDRCRPCLSNGTPFESCARLSSSGWWFHACADANLNGKYLSEEEWKACKESGSADKSCLGVKWNGGLPAEEFDSMSMRAAIMMLRPASGAK